MRVFALIGLLCISTLLFAQKQIDEKQSQVSFVVTNLGLKVDGKIRGISGEVNFDAEQLGESSFDITLAVKTIRTDNKMRDEHLMEEEFFDLANHPNIRFKSTEVKKTDKGFIVIGELSIKGVTKTISLPFQYTDNTFEGSFSIDRNEFNVGGNGFLDTIGDEVNITIRCKTV